VGVIDAGQLDVGDQPEVEQHHPAAGLDQHVGRLEIAMQLAGQVQRVDAVAQLVERVVEAGPIERRRQDVGARARADRPRLGGVELVVEPGVAGAGAGPHPIDEADATHQLHREEPLVAGGVQLVQATEVGVGQVAQRAELALEAVQVARALGLQGLERDVALVDPIEHAVDHAHAAGAELRLHDEAFFAERCALDGGPHAVSLAARTADTQRDGLAALGWRAGTAEAQSGSLAGARL
jgi:hypothetical protein